MTKEKNGRKNKNFVHSNMINLVQEFEKNLIKLCKNMKGIGVLVDDIMKDDNK